MPGLDGFEVCRRVKEAPQSKGTKIVAMTGFTDDQAEGMALACGADAFVSKRAGLEALGHRVKVLLDGDAAPATAGRPPKRSERTRVATEHTRPSRPQKEAREKRR
jgi:DNA-binding response OmpR family regulator